MVPRVSATAFGLLRPRMTKVGGWALSNFPFVLSDVSPRNEDHLQQLFLFAKEGLSIDAMDAFHQHTQLFNRFTVAAILRSEPVVTVVRRELRRLFPDIKVGNENLAAMIADEVIKRETLEGEKAKEAAGRIRKAGAKLERARKKEVVAVTI